MPTSYEWQYMGDRVGVTLTVLIEHKARALELLKKNKEVPGDIISDDTFSYLSYYEVNYGELHGLEKLTHEGIPFDSTWQAGGEFGEGTNYCRFTSKGEYVGLTLYLGDENPSMVDLFSHINNYEDLRDYILGYKKTYTPLPWDNQIEYGKIYRMTQLVTTS